MTSMAKSLLAGTAMVAVLALAGSPANATFVKSFTANGDKLYIDKEAKPPVTSFCGTVGTNAACMAGNQAMEINAVTDDGVSTGNGFANIKPDDKTTPALTMLTFTPEVDTVYSDFYFRGQLFGSVSDTGGLYPVNITVTNQFGNTESFDFFSNEITTDANGDFQPIGIVSTDDQRIRSVKISYSGSEEDNKGNVSTGFKEVKQIQFSTVVPIPAALPLMLTALGGLGLIARRRASGGEA